MKVKVLVAQLCLTLCNPMDCSPPGSSVHGISQARILEWVAVPFSRGIFPTQGSNSWLLHWQVDFFLPLSSQGGPGTGYSLKLFAHLVQVHLIPQGCAPWGGACSLGHVWALGWDHFLSRVFISTYSWLISSVQHLGCQPGSITDLPPAYPFLCLPVSISTHSRWTFVGLRGNLYNFQALMDDPDFCSQKWPNL